VCRVSARSAGEPVSAAATPLATAIVVLAASATSTLVALSFPSDACTGGWTAATRCGLPGSRHPHAVLGAGAMIAPMRVVIAEDQALLREGVVRLLRDAGFEVVAEAGDAPDLLRKVGAHKPDVAIVDVQMPPDNTDDGLRAALVIRERQPEVGVLVLSQHADARYAMDLIGDSAAGVGYLLKDRVADFAGFADAVRRVGDGGSALDPRVVSQMAGRARRDDPLAAFTAREREVLELMAEGRSNRGIAEVLVVTPHAVEKHVTSVFSKLGLGAAPEDHRRVLAVLAFLRG
jgi:DNA-binding NarL/FixJ family response regulator